MDIHIINGPNLNLIGERESQIYGTRSFSDYIKELKNEFPQITFHVYQSNHEGDLIDKIQAVKKGIVINPGGFTHTSVALADAIAAVDGPVIEVHISNIHARESFRNRSLTGTKAAGVISGLGLDSYRLGVLACLRLLENPTR